MRAVVATFVAAAGLFAGPTLAAPCPAERAIYTLKPDPAYTARWVPSKHHAGQASNLYLEVRTAQRSIWFTVGASNGYGGLFLNPVSDPYKSGPDGPRNLISDGREGWDLWSPDSAIYPMGRDLTVLADVPSKGDDAPHALFMPELGRAMWYGLGAIAEGAGLERDGMPRGVFVRTGCAATAPAPANP